MLIGMFCKWDGKEKPLSVKLSPFPALSPFPSVLFEEMREEQKEETLTSWRFDRQ